MKLQRIAKMTRAEIVRDSFQNNEKLRTTAMWLQVFGMGVMLFSLILFITSFLVSDKHETFPYLGGGIVFAFVGIAILCFASPMLERKADGLDYQLMAAFPDWKELISSEKTDKEADNKEADNGESLQRTSLLHTCSPHL